MTAPSTGEVIRFTYWHSPISDSEITAAISAAKDRIDDITSCEYYTAGDTLSSQTDYFDGDGESFAFALRKGRISSLSSYEIDALTSGYTENTDYFLYPESNYIKFRTPPSSDFKNVKLVYTYGTLINEIVKDAAAYYAAMKITVILMSKGGQGGDAGFEQSIDDRDVSPLKAKYWTLKREFKEAMSRLGYQVSINSIN